MQLFPWISWNKEIFTGCFHHKPFLSEDFHNGVHGLMNPASQRLKDDRAGDFESDGN